MAADPESTSWIASTLAAIGIGSGGGLIGLFTTQAAHGARIKRLEKDREKDSKAIQETHTTVTGLDVRTDRIEGDISTVLALLKKG